MFKSIIKFFSPLFKTSTRRWSDTNKHYGPLTVSNPQINHWSPVGFELRSSSGPHADDSPGCHLIIFLGGLTLLLELPEIIKPIVKKVYPNTWDEETIKRLGRNYYLDYTRKCYGFYVSEDYAHLHYGISTHNSLTDKSRCFPLNWKQDRYVKSKFFNHDGTLASTFYRETFKPNVKGLSWIDRFNDEKDKASKSHFLVQDSDGTLVKVSTYIEESEYRRGAGNFKWLSFFYTPRIYKKLDIQFHEEVGAEKGSWKGGLCGTSFEMVRAEKEDGQAFFPPFAGETSEECFKRFIAAESLKNGRRSVHLTFIKNITDEENTKPKVKTIVEQKEDYIKEEHVENLLKPLNF